MNSRGALIIGPVVSVVSAVVTALSGAPVFAIVLVFFLAGPVASLLFVIFSHAKTPDTQSHMAGFKLFHRRGARTQGPVGRDGKPGS